MRMPLNGPVALRIRKRLSAAICARYGSIRAYAAHLGEPYPSIRGPLLSQREFRLKFAEALCRDLGFDLWQLATPDEALVGPPSEGVIEVPVVNPVGCSDGEIVAETVGLRRLDPSFIPPGCVAPLLIRALDDGMLPGVEKGDLLLIDRDRKKREARALPQEGVLAVVLVGGRIVPRVVCGTANMERILVRPSNMAYRAEVLLTRDAALVVLGIIVGSWRGRREGE